MTANTKNVNRIEIHVGGMGEGAHIVAVMDDGSITELAYLSYVDGDPADAERIAKKKALEYGTEFVGWNI